MVDVGTIIFFPRTPVEIGHPGFPMGILALSSTKYTSACCRTINIRALKYLKIAAQKCASGCDALN